MNSVVSRFIVEPVNETGIFGTRNNVLNLNIYPNPSRGKQEIEFTLPKSGAVEVMLCDMAGRQIKNIYNGNLSAGRRKIISETSDLLPGAYFYRISTGVLVQYSGMIKQ
jgi:hypothetical protein